MNGSTIINNNRFEDSNDKLSPQLWFNKSEATERKSTSRKKIYEILGSSTTKNIMSIENQNSSLIKTEARHTMNFIEN